MLNNTYAEAEKKLLLVGVGVTKSTTTKEWNFQGWAVLHLGRASGKLVSSLGLASHQQKASYIMHRLPTILRCAYLVC